MSAEAIIDQIKALPPGEQAKVLEFMQQSAPQVKYMSPEKAKESIDRVMTKHHELMRLLSQ